MITIPQHCTRYKRALAGGLKVMIKQLNENNNSNANNRGCINAYFYYGSYALFISCIALLLLLGGSKLYELIGFKDLTTSEAFYYYDIKEGSTVKCSVYSDISRKDSTRLLNLGPEWIYYNTSIPVYVLSYRADSTIVELAINKSGRTYDTCFGYSRYLHRSSPPN